MLLIKNGTVCNPKDGTYILADIRIKDGKIEQIGQCLEKDAKEKVIDAAGCIIAPGLVDVHVHFRDPGFLYKEDILTGAKAAAKGGFTSVICMANTKPAADNAETLAYIIDKGRQTGIHVYTCASVTKGLQGTKIVPMEQLQEAGAVGFTDDGIPILNENIVIEAMKEAKRLNMPISLHEENPKFITNNGINEGEVSQSLSIGGSKKEAEINLIQRDLELAIETGASVNVQHISTKEGVALVREAKKKSPNIHAEATPHHFTLTEEAVRTHGTLAKMNPPLRKEEDRQAIIEGLKDGTIDFIATDHAPHSKEEKEKSFTQAPSGIIGLETALSLGITELVKKEYLSTIQLMTLMSYNPAKLYHLDAGYLEAGGPADIVIFKADEPYMVDSFVSKSENSPFLGAKLYGKVYYTICKGSIVYQA